MKKLLLSLLMILCLVSYSNAASILVDAGHTEENPGVISARGNPELSFNILTSMTLGKKLANQGHTVYFVTNISLKDRVKVINELKPDLVISIHHDSVQEKYLSKWIYNGKEYSYCDKFSGYSIFVSKKNKDFTNSFRFAKLVGENLLKSGLYPTYHHNEPIEGENKEFLNKDLGVYRYDNLVVLQTNIPSILLECGIIINRSDELVLRTDYMINTITDSVVKAIRVYFNNHSL